MSLEGAGLKQKNGANFSNKSAIVSKERSRIRKENKGKVIFSKIAIERRPETKED